MLSLAFALEPELRAWKNFDRPWKTWPTISGYNPEVARNISVDIRFLLWLLEDVQHADYVVRELGLTR